MVSNWLFVLSGLCFLTEHYVIDAFLVFGNTPKIEGKTAVTQYFKEQLGYLDLMDHMCVLPSQASQERSGC